MNQGNGSASTPPPGSSTAIKKGYERKSTGYAPRPLQFELHKKLKRFSVLVCHRRFGKTVFSINEMIARGLRCKHPNPRCAYLAPLYGQAKRVAWDYLKQYTANLPGATPNEADLRVDVPRPDRGDSVRFTLLGADNPASLKGIYLDMVVLDEYADMNPTVWGEVIRPTLSDRNGRAIFIGTPKGRNAFHELFMRSTEGFKGEDGTRAKDAEWFGALFKASETGIISASELESAKKEMSEDEYEQEFECSFNAGLTGAYYSKEMTAVEKEGRIMSVPYDPTLPVTTFWDLGVNDTTCIGFFQRYGAQWRCIDYLEECGQGIPYYIKELKKRPYVYEPLMLPHDARARDLSTGKSREEVFRNYGYRTRILPKLDIADGISAVRNIIPRVVFDQKKTERLRECLINYQRKWNAKNLVFEDQPLHNQYSNGADMFRYFALGAKEESRQSRSSLPTHADSDYDLFNHS